MTLASILTESRKRQQLASNPAASAWVSASAGTGKTKVLTDRVLRLMLDGTPPQRILCLTFTRSAAAEMANRLNQRLVSWATINDEQLIHDVKTLTGTKIDGVQAERARRLLACVLDAPGGMRIQTIHSFCESLLGQFPLEANVIPHFSVMDEQAAVELLETTRDELLNHLQNNENSNLAKALGIVALHTQEAGFRDLITQLISDRARIAHLLADGGLQGAANQIRAALSLVETDTPTNIIATACTDDSFDLRSLNAASEAMEAGQKTDIERAIRIKSWVSKSPETRIVNFDDYCRAFLTTDNKALSRLVTKSVPDNTGCVLLTLQREQNRILTIRDRRKKSILSESTISLLTVGDALISAYQNKKNARNFLDYDDLILKSKDMLLRPGIPSWVLYKLDGGIDHILIDEAQDTNPDQWQIIQALSEEFFAGVGARKEKRTVFAVGDTKQSIYSFQRADPNSFDQMRKFFKDRVRGSCSEWNDIELDISFRSSGAVLEAVDLVFSNPAAQDGVVKPETSVKHYPARSEAAGLVEVWPLIETKRRHKKIPWEKPVNRTGGDSAHARLASLVAEKIKILCSEEILLSQDRPIRPGDIMVLVRRRNAFVGDLVRALKTNQIAVSGVDRLILTDHIAVMDLISLGRFLLMPDDDLSLAEVLKSPLCGLDDDDLFTIAHGRHGSLWQALHDHSDQRSEFTKAKTTLGRLLDQANEKPPYELYAELLSADGGRRAFQSRIGEEVLDPLDEFLTQALSYQSRHVPSLQGFLDWLERGRLIVRRDFEQRAADAVRILTVHGAKGLEAPIVFLPDTVQVPDQTPRLLWSTDQRCLLWAARKAWLDNIAGAWSKTAEERRDREYRRLLYVAMTRAEDRLYVCGWTGQKTLNQRSWYNLIHAGIKDRAKTEHDTFLATRKDTTKAAVLRLVHPQAGVADTDKTPAKHKVSPTLPDWAWESPPAEPPSPQHLIRSELVASDTIKPGPIDCDTKPLHRGQLIHKLLQWLPQYPPETRATKTKRFLAHPGLGLNKALRDDIAVVALKVLAAPEFAPLFSSESRADIAVTGCFKSSGRTYNVSGNIDRLTVREDLVRLVYFKTDQHTPTEVTYLGEQYLQQIALYRAVLARIYSDRPIECALLWTEKLQLTILDNKFLDQWLP